MTRWIVARRGPAVLGVVVAAAALAACGADTSPTAGPTAGPSGSVTVPPLEGQDAAAYQRWLDAGIDDYRFAVTQACECNAQRYVVTVRHGEVESVRPESGAYWREATVAVPDLFALIADAREGYPKVEVDYDPTLGYPRRIFEDRIINAIDDEVTYVVTDFQQL